MMLTVSSSFSSILRVIGSFHQRDIAEDGLKRTVDILWLQSCSFLLNLESVLTSYCLCHICPIPAWPGAMLSKILNQPLVLLQHYNLLFFFFFFVKRTIVHKSLCCLMSCHCSLTLPRRRTHWKKWFGMDFVGFLAWCLWNQWHISFTIMHLPLGEVMKFRPLWLL